MRALNVVMWTAEGVRLACEATCEEFREGDAEITCIDGRKNRKKSVTFREITLRRFQQDGREFNVLDVIK